MRRCHEPHPEIAESLCVVPEGQHLDHIDLAGNVWPNGPAREAHSRRPTKRGKGRRAGEASDAAKAKIKEIAAAVERERRVNPLADGRRPATTGVPAASAVEWSKEAWAHETTGTLQVFLVARQEPFTTPEHLWPLIDSPNGDMRAMSVVVQAALRGQWIEEVGSKRLRDVYRTRDGVEFAMNKLVPIYRSKIFGESLDSRRD